MLHDEAYKKINKKIVLRRSVPNFTSENVYGVSQFAFFLIIKWMLIYT